MVNPIGANPGSLPFVPAAVDLERPLSIPEPAVQVTPSGEALNSGGAATAPRQPQDADANPNSLEKALEDVNDNMKAWATGMRFDVDPDAQRVVVSIIDSATGEVLRTVPSDAVIRVAKMIVQLQGQVVNTKA
ncbi:flagellar protein FlaG [Pollutimonas bauzanensis]|uniref:Flagellar protein FlaG n=1 Tax=Pollutimonas bauzanensis TaxID=658167 RepID=A0A1M5Z425_9BURK|nr:flagellar protein FlaG [Pollutimonas bauzanensis]SHI18931.1 flagellar protein FlaG [Pollutimonas bauzanensis]